MDTILHTTFLSENPESFGLVSDARPMAVGDLAVAAHGYVLPGKDTPLFIAEEPGVLGLLQEVYDGILTPTESHIRVLRHTFGESDGRQDHPVGRYAAALAEATVLDILSAPTAADLPGDRLAGQTSRAVSDRLDDLRVHLNSLSSESEIPADAFAVSLAACRITRSENENCIIDLFGAGDYAFFLLDETGLAPLWLTRTPPLSPMQTNGMQHQTVDISPSGPFAVVILSDSLVASDNDPTRASGWVWRDRIRREEQLLRTVVMTPVEEDFGDRAAHAYAGQAVGRDSATGALLYVGGDYEDLYAACQRRLRVIEDLITLWPEGYDDRYRHRSTEEQPPLETVENEFIHYAFTSHPELLQRTADRLSDLALSILRQGETTDGENCEENNDPRLTYDIVYDVFSRYDAENLDDRRLVEANRRVIHDLLCDHWITLRPILCPEEACDETDPDYAAACERAYDSCRRLNARLTGLLDRRQKALSDIEKLLEESLLILRASGEDWMHGRGGDANAATWLSRLMTDGPATLSAMEAGWQEGSETCRRLQSAYTAERACLFARDIHPERGIWRSTYEAVQNGQLPRGSWNLYAERCVDVEDGTGHEAYAEVLLVLRTVSEGIRVLLDRMEGRATERRAAHHIGGDEGWQMACIRGVLRRDPAWDACAGILPDETLRSEYDAIVRRWEETRALISRREEAFKAYYQTYTSFLPADDLP